MKQNKTEKEMINLVRQHIEKNVGAKISGPVWFTVTTVGCDDGNWRIAHSSDAAGLQDALTNAEEELGRAYSLVP